MELFKHKPSLSYQVRTYSWVERVHVWAKCVRRSTTSKHIQHSQGSNLRSLACTSRTLPLSHDVPLKVCFIHIWMLTVSGSAWNILNPTTFFMTVCTASMDSCSNQTRRLDVERGPLCLLNTVKLFYWVNSQGSDYGTSFCLRVCADANQGTFYMLWKCQVLMQSHWT